MFSRARSVIALAPPVTRPDQPRNDSLGPERVNARFADPAIARLGADLDHQLGELLKALGVEAAEVL
jgi:hypothetical protein